MINIIIGILGNVSTLCLMIFLWVYLKQGGHSEDFDVAEKKKKKKQASQVPIQVGN